MEIYNKQLEQELNDIVVLVRGNLDKLCRCTLEAMIVLDVHSRVIISQLVKD